MVRCDKIDCTEPLTYLPFRCRYCGGTFCKIHRLPENHNCSFSMDVSTEPTTHSQSKEIPYDSNKSEKYASENHEAYPGTEFSDEFEDQVEKEMRDYIKAQERASMPPPPSRSSPAHNQSYRPFISRTNQMKGTFWFIGLTLGSFILKSILPNGELLMLFDIRVVFSKYYVWTIFTSLITPNTIFNCLIALFMLYSLGRTIELQYGTRFMITFYGIIGLVGVLVTSIIQLILTWFGILSPLYSDPVSMLWTCILGMMTFILYIVGLNREMRMYLYFIPVRLKAKYILYIFIGQAVIFGVLGLFIPSFSTAGSIAQLAGIFVGKKFFDRYSSRTNSAAFY